MSRPRFLADNDLIDAIVDGVLRREPSIEFGRVRDVGMRASSDPEILEYAATRGLIVVSHDMNTLSAFAYDRVRASLPMPGLILTHQDAPIAPVIEDLLTIWLATEAEEWPDQVRYLPV